MKLQLLIIALFIGGCASVPHPSTTINHVGNGLTRITTDVDAASGAITQAVPHSDPEGKAHLVDATSNLTDAHVQLVQSEKDVTAALAQAAKLEQVNAGLTDQLAAKHKSFWSDRQKAIFYWAIAISAGLFVLQIVLGAYGLAGAGIAADISAVVAKVVGLANPIIGYVVTWITTHIHTQKAVQAALMTPVPPVEATKNV